jgi:hypothetical protein
MRIVCTRSEQELWVILKVILAFSRQNKDTFSEYFRSFSIRNSDSLAVCEVKLDILECIVSPLNKSWILNEFKVFIHLNIF